MSYAFVIKVWSANETRIGLPDLIVGAYDKISSTTIGWERRARAAMAASAS